MDFQGVYICCKESILNGVCKAGVTQCLAFSWKDKKGRSNWVKHH